MGYVEDVRSLMHACILGYIIDLLVFIYLVDGRVVIISVYIILMFSTA
jgi:hypothetical protein